MSLRLPALLLGTLLCTLAALADAPRLYRNQIPFSAPNGTPLVLDASIPRSPHFVPALLIVHGGGWEAGDRRTYIGPLLRLLDESPYAWFSIDYRLAPAHPFPAAAEDVAAAIRWLRENARDLGVDSRHIVLIGESAGGHLVSLAGAQQRGALAGVVSFYGIHNFESWAQQRGGVPRNASLLLGVTDLNEASKPRLQQASPVHFLHKEMPPYLLIHGTADEGVPLAQSEEMCTRLRALSVPCELFAIPDAGHGMENWEAQPRFQTWKPKLLEWLNTLFRNTP